MIHIILATTGMKEQEWPSIFPRSAPIDVHVHADVSCHDPEDPVMAGFFDAASAYFKIPRERPKMSEIAEIYREQRIALCLFTVDCESGIGAQQRHLDESLSMALHKDNVFIDLSGWSPKYFQP